MKKSVITVFLCFMCSAFSVLAVSQLSASPQTINVGEEISISLIPGDQGASGYMYLYGPSDAFIDYYQIGCASSRCTEPVDLTITVDPSWANGEYSLKVYDYDSRQLISSPFQVTGSTAVFEPTGVSLTTSQLSAGDRLHFSLSAGSLGFYRYAFVYTADNQYKQYIPLECGENSYKCMGDLSALYILPDTLEPGNYQLRVYDFSTSSFVAQDFEIVQQQLSTFHHSGPHELFTCSKLNESNTVYELKANLTHAGKCMRITADNVVLDCKGNSIATTSTGQNSIAIQSTGRNATIENCNLVGPQSGTYGQSSGIYLTNLLHSDSLIRYNTITGYGMGMDVRSGHNLIHGNSLWDNIKAVHLMSSSRAINNIVRNNNVYDNTRGQGWGLAIWRGSENKFIDNDVTGNRYGIVLKFTENTSLICGDISGNFRNDTYLYSGSGINKNVVSAGIDHERSFIGSGAEFTDVDTSSYCGGAGNSYVYTFACPAFDETEYSFTETFCEYGCLDGACLPPNSCTDSDGGVDLLTPGFVTQVNINGTQNFTDSCGPLNYLTEYYCISNTSSAFSHSAHCSHGCHEGACLPSPVCTDTDGGINQNVSGVITVDNGTGTNYTSVDTCFGSTLLENYCHNNTYAQTTQITCEQGCQFGVCLNNPTCTDSDGGINEDVFGTVTLDTGTGAVHQANDTCISSLLIREYSCSISQTIVSMTTTCQNGCQGGVCLPPPEPEGDQFQFTSVWDKLNLYQTTGSIQSTLSGTELSTLESGTFDAQTPVPYTHSLIPPNFSQVVWGQDDEISDNPQLMLKVPNGGRIYYNLDFLPSSATSRINNSRLVDFEGKTINILGSEFTIISAIQNGSGMDLHLQSGSDFIRLNGDSTKVYIDHPFDPIDDAAVWFSSATSGNSLQWYRLTLILNQPTDFFVTEGSNLTEAARAEDEFDYERFLNTFGFNLWYTGLTPVQDEEVRVIRDTNSSLEILFTNKNGVDYLFPALYWDQYEFDLNFGKYPNKDLNTKEGSRVCDESYFIVENDNTSRVLQVKNIRNTTNESYVEVKDLGTGGSTQYDFGLDGVADLNMDGYTYQLKHAPYDCVDAIETTDDADGEANLWTQYGLEVSIINRSLSNYNCSIGFREPQQEFSGEDSYCFSLNRFPGTLFLDFQGVVRETPDFELSMITLDSDPNTLQGYTKYGAFLEHKKYGSNALTLTMPSEEREALVYATSNQGAES